ncbi:MAG TPA: hypothetical protein VFB74_15200 [Kribbellaceae bacterium]|nr:hypothetical protein [Kribbellaceae bacterium]
MTRNGADVTAPKLVIASDADANVPLAATREVYDRAPGPKQFVSYPSSAHGVQLFAGDHRDEVSRRIVDFVMSTVPA